MKPIQRLLTPPMKKSSSRSVSYKNQLKNYYWNVIDNVKNLALEIFKEIMLRIKDHWRAANSHSYEKQRGKI